MGMRKVGLWKPLNQAGSRDHWCPLSSTGNQTGDNNLSAVCKSLLMDSPGCMSQTLTLFPVIKAANQVLHHDPLGCGSPEFYLSPLCLSDQAAYHTALSFHLLCLFWSKFFSQHIHSNYSRTPLIDSEISFKLCLLWAELDELRPSSWPVSYAIGFTVDTICVRSVCEIVSFRVQRGKETTPLPSGPPKSVLLYLYIAGSPRFIMLSTNIAVLPEGVGSYQNLFVIPEFKLNRFKEWICIVFFVSLFFSLPHQVQHLTSACWTNEWMDE